MDDDFDPDDPAFEPRDTVCQVCRARTDGTDYCSNECFEQAQEDAEAEADAEVIELEMMWRLQHDNASRG